MLRVVLIKPLHHLSMKPLFPKHKHGGVGTLGDILPQLSTSVMQVILQTEGSF